MMQLTPYAEYKDSGQPFIGKIPTHWNLFRNGRLFSQRNETGFGELPILEVSLKTGVRVRDMDNLKRKQVMADREKYKRAAQGDIAYNMMRMWQGAVGVAPVDGLVSPAYVVVRPFPEVDCRYFSYLFRTTAYMNEVDAYSRGIVKDRNRLYWQDFKRMPSPVPPVEEQRHIARFLDAVGSKARLFIRNKRQLIELLKEQKQNIINQTVTRGLDANAKFKPSDVEWIGDIPEHWEVRKVKYLFDERVQKGFPTEPLLAATQTQGVVQKSMYETRTVVAQKDLHLLKLVEVGDFVISLRSFQGGIEQAYFRGIISPAYTVMIPQQEVKGEYFKYLAKSKNFIELLRASVTGIREGQNIDYERLRKSFLPVPDIEEQKRIAVFLNSETEKIDQAISRAQREIELMREYRTRLIADVVTGQVDVRGIEVPEVAEAEVDASSPLQDEDTAEADDLLDADGEVEAGE